MSYYDNYYLEDILLERNRENFARKKQLEVTAGYNSLEDSTTHQDVQDLTYDDLKQIARAQNKKYVTNTGKHEPKIRINKNQYSEPIGPTKPETNQAVTTAADAAKTKGGTTDQQQQTAEAAANAQGKQKAKMSTKKKIGIGAGAAAGVAGLAIGAKMTYDYAKYKKWKAKNPLRKNVTFKQWKSEQKKKLHESFNEGYQAALEEFYY